MSKKTINIDGMHCKACEMLIKHELEEIDGVDVKSLSHKTSKVTIECDASVNEEEICAAIKKAGYELKDSEDTKEKKSSGGDWFEKTLWIFGAGILVYILTQIDLTSLMPTGTLGWSMAFVVGLVASVSTCLAVTGGIVVGYSESVKTTRPWWTHIKFHIGRLIAFVVGGALLGLIGEQFGSSVWFNAILSILVGLVLAYVGLQVLGIVPNITRWGFHLPAGLSKGIFSLKDPKYAPIVGALTFLLPCGFTQSMQLLAMQSGSPWTGAVIMGAFALGTVPVLLGLGVGTRYIKDKLTKFNTVIAMLLIAFGFYTIINGGILISAVQSATANEIVASHLPQEKYDWGHNGLVFEPETLVLKKDTRYEISVTPKLDGMSCLSQLIIPGKGVIAIKKGKTFTFEINNDGSNKTVPIVCASMGMKAGEIRFE